MDDIKLKSYIRVCTEGSFTKAAEYLYLSPVAVKNHIDSLESELGETLLTRKPTGCAMTTVGKTFFDHAQIIIENIEKAKSDVEKAGIYSRGEILIGHNIPLSYSFAGNISIGFSEKHKDRMIQFEKMPKEKLIDSLLKRNVNCLFAESTLFDNPDRYGVEFFPVAHLPVYAIMKKGHELSEFKSLPISMLSNQELYITSSLSNEVVESINKEGPKTVQLIEKTDRNILFNRIIKNAIEIYPRKDFDYYDCVRLETPPITIGIFYMTNHPKIIDEMIHFVKMNVEKMGDDIEKIL